MIFKKTYLVPIDKCGVWWVNTFHLYGGYSRKVSHIGDFIKISVRNTRPNNWVAKKSKSIGIIVQTKKEIRKSDGTNIWFKNNSVVLLKKRLTPKGKEIVGPTVFNIKRKRFLMSFAGVI
jgi:large subunit ribosomal protein L14